MLCSRSKVRHNGNVVAATSLLLLITGPNTKRQGMRTVYSIPRHDSLQVVAHLFLIVTAHSIGSRRPGGDRESQNSHEGEVRTSKC